MERGEDAGRRWEPGVELVGVDDVVGACGVVEVFPDGREKCAVVKTRGGRAICEGHRPVGALLHATDEFVQGGDLRTHLVEVGVEQIAGHAPD